MANGFLPPNYAQRVAGQDRVAAHQQKLAMILQGIQAAAQGAGVGGQRYRKDKDAAAALYMQLMKSAQSPQEVRAGTEMGRERFGYLPGSERMWGQAPALAPRQTPQVPSRVPTGSPAVPGGAIPGTPRPGDAEAARKRMAARFPTPDVRRAPQQDPRLPGSGIAPLAPAMPAPPEAPPEPATRSEKIKQIIANRPEGFSKKQLSNMSRYIKTHPSLEALKAEADQIRTETGAKYDPNKGKWPKRWTGKGLTREQKITLEQDRRIDTYIEKARQAGPLAAAQQPTRAEAAIKPPDDTQRAARTAPGMMDESPSAAMKRLGITRDEARNPLFQRLIAADIAKTKKDNDALQQRREGYVYKHGGLRVRDTERALEGDPAGWEQRPTTPHYGPGYRASAGSTTASGAASLAEQLWKRSEVPGGVRIDRENDVVAGLRAVVARDNPGLFRKINLKGGWHSLAKKVMADPRHKYRFRLEAEFKNVNARHGEKRRLLALRGKLSVAERGLAAMRKKRDDMQATALMRSQKVALGNLKKAINTKQLEVDNMRLQLGLPLVDTP